ncbi:MAG TPA: AAA family ATPase, partial [Actinomycetes bacterium]|nr:AAA family ATPase [Actinomycetes bacterium]
GRARAIAGRPLLPGHTSAWVEDRRAALHQLEVSCLELLCDAHLAAGQAPLAVAAAADLVDLEPFRDSAYRRLLAAHSAAGDRGEALRAYDRYRRVLAEELGVGPSPELEAAYLGLLRAEPAGEATAPPAQVAPGGPPPAPVPGEFVGRRPELRRLEAAWAEARGGRRRTVVVAGEAGIGKTRLATELASLAERDAAAVLAGRCDQHLGVPYLSLREAVGRHLATYPSERLRGLLGPRAVELARFWPELAWRLPALPAAPATGPDTDPYLLLEALGGLLDAVAAGGPLLLLIDDLQGADEASLLLLRRLVVAPRPARLLTVLTYRDDERAPRASLTAALGDLVRAPGAEVLTLGGLGPGEVAELAAAVAGRPLGHGGAALARVVHQRTGGNPFLAGELLRHLAETGGLDGDATGAATGPAADDVPESVRWVVGQRLARLGGPVEHVLEAAAVVGQEAELAVLGRVTDLGWSDLLAALDAAVAARLLEERPGLPGGYAFSQPIVRDVLYRRLPASERARAHRRAGEALEERTGGTGRLGELADHFTLAGVPFAGRAAGYAERAGAHAQAGGRHEEAAQRLGQALALLERGEVDAAGPERCGRLLCAQADAWAAAGQAHQATEAYLRAAAAGRTAGSAEVLARAALGLGGPTGIWSVELDRAVPTGLLGEALEAVGLGDSPARALLLGRLAGWRAVGSRLEAGEPEPPGFAEAVAMARRLDDRRALASVLADQEAAWSGLLRPDGPAAALAVSAELDRLAAELGDDGLVYQASRARAAALLATGDLDGIDRLTEREARTAATRRLPRHLWLSLRIRSAMAMLRGDFGECERLAADADELGRRSAGAAAAIAHGGQLVLLRWLQGRPAQVEALLERLAAEQAWAAKGWATLLPLAYAGQGRDADARRHLDRAMAALPAQGLSVTTLVALVAACAQLGDGDGAGRLSALLVPWAGHHLAAGHAYLGAADHHLGILAATAGRLEDGLGHLQAALAAHERLGARPWQALSAQAFAATLRGRDLPGDQGRAAALDTTAHALAGRLGMELPGWGRPVLGPCR